MAGQVCREDVGLLELERITARTRRSELDTFPAELAKQLQ